jgi:hypothetical protein
MADAFKQIDQFEQFHLLSKKPNKYPNIQFEEALNYHKRFAEHLAIKKT